MAPWPFTDSSSSAPAQRAASPAATGLLSAQRSADDSIDDAQASRLPADGGWAALAPMQRSVPAMTPTVQRATTVKNLTSWHAPQMSVAPLGHAISAEAPTGTVGGLATATAAAEGDGQPQRSTDLPALPMRHVQRADRPVQTVQRWQAPTMPKLTTFSPAPVQRSTGPAMTSAPPAAHPTLSLPSVDVVSPQRSEAPAAPAEGPGDDEAQASYQLPVQRADAPADDEVQASYQLPVQRADAPADDEVQASRDLPLVQRSAAPGEGPGDDEVQASYQMPVQRTEGAEDPEGAQASYAAPLVGQRSVQRSAEPPADDEVQASRTVPAPPTVQRSRRLGLGKPMSARPEPGTAQRATGPTMFQPSGPAAAGPPVQRSATGAAPTIDPLPLHRGVQRSEAPADDEAQASRQVPTLGVQRAEAATADEPGDEGPAAQTGQAGQASRTAPAAEVESPAEDDAQASRGLPLVQRTEAPAEEEAQASRQVATLGVQRAAEAPAPAEEEGQASRGVPVQRAETPAEEETQASRGLPLQRSETPAEDDAQASRQVATLGVQRATEAPAPAEEEAQASRGAPVQREEAPTDEEAQASRGLPLAQRSEAPADEEAQASRGLPLAQRSEAPADEEAQASRGLPLQRTETPGDDDAQASRQVATLGVQRATDNPAEDEGQASRDVPAGPSAGAGEDDGESAGGLPLAQRSAATPSAPGVGQEPEEQGAPEASGASGPAGAQRSSRLPVAPLLGGKPPLAEAGAQRSSAQRASDPQHAPSTAAGGGAAMATWNGAPQRAPESAPTSVLAEVQRATGVDVSDTPIHRNTEHVVQRMGARAFAHEGEVHVPQKIGALDSGEGKSLVAHELVHVAQQKKLGSSRPAESTPDGQKLEAQAQRMELAMMHNQPAPDFKEGDNLPLAQRAPTQAGEQTVRLQAQAEQTSSILLQSGLAQRAEDGSLNFTGVHPGKPETVQRTAESGLAAASAALTGGVQQAAKSSGAKGSVESTDAMSDVELDRMAERLFPRIRAKLTREFRIDRERFGSLTDFTH